MDPPSHVVIVIGSSRLIGTPVVGRFAGFDRVVGFDREGNPHPPKEAMGLRR